MSRNMKKHEMRKTAQGAVRSEIRRQERNPLNLSSKEALVVLDDLCRAEPTLVASMWYAEASKNQIKLFEQEWKRENEAAF